MVDLNAAKILVMLSKVDRHLTRTNQKVCDSSSYFVRHTFKGLSFLRYELLPMVYVYDKSTYVYVP